MKPDTVERRHMQVFKVLKHISANLEKSHTIRELSRIACSAPFHFHRIFREVTGEPVHRYIRRLRLEFSAHQLLFTDASIIRIAMDAGYQSHEAYTRAFQQSFGMAPSRYRARFRWPQDREIDRSADVEPSTGELPRLLPVREPVRLHSRGRQLVAFCPYFGPYAEVSRCWRQLRERLEERGLSAEGLQALGVMYDDPLDRMGESIRYDACVVLPPSLSPGPDLGVQVLPEMESVGIVHHGPHELLIHSYIRLLNAWVTLEHAPRIRRLPYYEMYSRFPYLDGGEQSQAEVHVALF